MILHSQPWIIKQDQDSVKACLASAMLSKGSVTAELEQKLAASLNKKYAVFTGNGTQAQLLLLMALGIGEGDEVILPTYVCDKVLKGVLALNATPVLCDTGMDGNMTPETIAEKITPSTKAIILVHIFGRNAWTDDMDKLGIPIIEDVCQSLGHLNENFRTGTHTNMAFTSFHGTKCLPAGEGGMLFVNGDDVYEKILQLKARSGYITSGTDLVSSLVLSQFYRYDTILKNRLALAEAYNHSIDSRLVETEKQLFHSGMHYRYVLTSKGDWNAIQQAYLEQGIHVRKGVDSLLHRQLGLSDAAFPNAVQAFETAVSIPILPQLTQNQAEHIVEVTQQLAKKGIL